MAYKFFQVRVSSEEVLQAHVPILPAPEDTMAALWQAHVAAPGFLQLGILCRACAHQHLQTLHTEAPVSVSRENGHQGYQAIVLQTKFPGA